MVELVASLDPRLALAVHVAVSVATVVAVLLVAWLLREKRPPEAGYGIYESGAPDVMPAARPVAASYFMIAAFFVVFDLEAAILFTWAAAAPDVGWPGLVSAGIFIAVLLAALFYLWADGALDVGPRFPVGGWRPTDTPGDTP